MDDKLEPGQNSDNGDAQTISRREFLIRAGAASALAAGSVATGLKLWQRNAFVPGFQAGDRVSTP